MNSEFGKILIVAGIAPALAGLAVFLCVAGAVHATDLSDAQGTVNNIREPDLPQASTDTKRDPSGDPVEEYKPSGPSPTIEEPPSPVDKNNPQNDPDVQKGYDAHQKWYYGKEK